MGVRGEVAIKPLLIGLLLTVATITPKPIKPQQINNSVEPIVVEQTDAQPEVEVVEKQPTWKELSREQKIKLNPNKCDLEKQVMWESDGSCHTRKTSPTVTTKLPISCEHYRALVSKYNWNVNVAMAVMRAESGCNPQAANWNDHHATCTGSFGLFQLGCFWISNPYNPEANVAKAYEIYSRSGWRPWGAYTSGAYRRYL